MCHNKAIKKAEHIKHIKHKIQNIRYMKNTDLTIVRIEKIARNINAMDMQYEYLDNNKRYKFWRNLKDKLDKILSNLNEADKELIKTLCETENAKYFNLI